MSEKNNISLDEAIGLCRQAEEERQKKRNEMEPLTLELLTFDSESLGEAVKCYILNETSERLNDTALEVFAIISKIRVSTPI